MIPMQRESFLEPLPLGRFMGISCLVFVFLAVAVAAQNRWTALALQPVDEVLSWWIYLGIELPVWLTWWLLLPLIEVLRRMLRPTRSPGGTWHGALLRGLLHVPAGMAVAWLGVLVVAVFRVYVWYPQPIRTDLWPLVDVGFRSGVMIRLFLYLGIVALLEMLALQRQAERRTRREQALRLSLTEAKLDGLQARLQPHFLFNTLNAVSGLMGQDVSAARTALASLSDLLRDVLEDGDGHEISLEEEWTLLERYLELLVLRFGERLSWNLDAPPGLERLAVPRLILQPLVENVVKHGLEQTRLPVHLMITGRRQDDDQGPRLELVVEDDGPGPPAEWQLGVGLGSTAARLDALYGDAAGWQLETAPDGGAIQRLWLPVERSL